MLGSKLKSQCIFSLSLRIKKITKKLAFSVYFRFLSAVDRMKGRKEEKEGRESKNKMNKQIQN